MEEVEKWLLSWWTLPGFGFVLAIVRFVVRRRSPGQSVDPWQPIRFFAKVTTANVRLTYREREESDLEQEMAGLREDLARVLTDNERLRKELSASRDSSGGSTGSAGVRSRSRSSTRRSRR